MKAESESELAGVMAHEIAHIAARHGTKQATPWPDRQPRHHPVDFHGRLGRGLRHSPGRKQFLG